MYQMLCFPQKKGKEFFRGLQYEAILSFTKCALAPSPVVLLLVNTFALLPECVHLLHCSYITAARGILLHHIFSGNLLCGFTVFLYHLIFLSFFSSFLPLLLFSFTPACLLSPLLFLLLLLLSISCPISCFNTHRNMAQHSEWHQQVRCHHKCKAVDLSVELASAALFSSKTCCRIFSIC